jgi:hypothetical protein
MLNMKRLKQNTLKKKTTNVKYATKPQATCITKKEGVSSCVISPLSWLFAVRATTAATTK